jgi:uncharacterized metal-binding protein YceD (DUF177 family)
MMQDAVPLERFYDLDSLGRAGADVAIVADAEALKRLAAWAEVEAVESFKGEVALKKTAATRFSLDYTLDADIVQSCVVTLEPVRSHIAQTFSRELHLSHASAHRHAVKSEELTLAAGDDDAVEEIESQRYDLAGPLLEEFVLAIDPYPRAPGAVLPESPETVAPPRESPFAALKALKDRS